MSRTRLIGVGLVLLRAAALIIDSIFLSFYISLSLSFSLSVSVFLSVCSSFFLPIWFFLLVSFCLFLWFFQSVSFCLHFCLSVFLSTSSSFPSCYAFILLSFLFYPLHFRPYPLLPRSIAILLPWIFISDLRWGQLFSILFPPLFLRLNTSFTHFYYYIILSQSTYECSFLLG